MKFNASLPLLILWSWAMLPGCLQASDPVDDWVRQVEFANTLVDRGGLDQAEKVYRKALEHAQAAGDDQRASVVLHNLGRLLDRKGHALQAEKAFQQAIHALTRAPFYDEELLVRTYAGLSAVYIQTGQFSKAETLIRSVLADHPAGAASDTASLMGDLGAILVHKHQFEEAAQVLRKTAEACAGMTSPDVQEVGAIAIANLAGLQLRAGRTADAIASYQQALSIMEALPSPSPATLAVTLADYAKAARVTENRGLAESLYRRAIAVAEARLGRTHYVLGTLLQQYAELLRAAGRKSEARKLMDAARRIQSEWNRENMTGHTVDIHTLSILENR